MSLNRIQIIERALEREKKARKTAEKILELKSREIFESSQILKRSNVVINNIAKSILGLQSYYDIAREIARQVGEYLDANDCVVYLVNHEQGYVEQIAAYGNKCLGGEIVNKTKVPIGEGIVGCVVETGDVELISDTSVDTRYITDLSTNYSEITVPIIVEDKVIGIIDSEHKEKDFFTGEHLSTLKNISRVVAMQLNNAISLEKKRIAEEKYKKINSQLQRKNEALEEYAHIVSHDLKSPLRSISTLIDWIKEDNIDKINENSIPHFDLVQKSLQHMETLISDILEYSKIDSEVIVYENVDIKKLLNDLVLVLYKPEGVEVNIKGNLPANILIDRTQIKQVFQNLVGNAFKFIDKEKGRVEVGYEDLDTHHKFYVKDNGEGIEDKYFEKIFKVFQSLNKSKESTGIGLSIVKKIVELNNGEIWLESKLGFGTIFYFTLKKHSK